MKRALIALVLAALARGEMPVRLDKDVAMKTRDGTTLKADIFRPAAAGRFPVLLQRTPYDKGSWPNGSAVMLAGHGYIVVIQDTRGRYASEGEFYPFQYEAQDGYDTVEWAATLPFSNGRVGMYGMSYVGATQWLAAVSKPPHLVSIFPGVTPSDYYRNWVYRGGAFELWFSGSWVNGSLAPDTLARQMRAATRPLDLMKTLPLALYAPAMLPPVAAVAPYLRDWLEHEQDGPWWSRWSIEPAHEKLELTTYSWGGWYDIFLPGTLRNFERMRKLHPPRRHYLTVGPWTHYPIDAATHKYGEIDFGTAAAFDADAELLHWADLTLKHVEGELAKRAPVRLFVMGENVWRDEQAWPLARARTAEFYLGPNRALQREPAAGGPPDEFTYDPQNPVPTRGGPLCCENDLLPPGPFDQSMIEQRPDVLVYTTTPLEAAVEVTGPVSAVLFVGSDAPDTDFTAKLVDVHLDGKAYNLTSGILRLRRRDGLDRQAPPLRKDAVYRVEIDMAATSNLFQPGHRIRVEVSSSNFPQFDRNLNTGEPLSSGKTVRVARNRVYHDARHRSAILLPVVPR